jgi:hypothetical protein
MRLRDTGVVPRSIGWSDALAVLGVVLIIVAVVLSVLFH